MLTAHERPTLPDPLSAFHAVVLAHAKPACVWLRQTILAKLVCNRRSGPHFRQNQSPPRTIRPTSPIQRPQKAISRPLKSHR